MEVFTMADREGREDGSGERRRICEEREGERDICGCWEVF